MILAENTVMTVVMEYCDKKLSWNIVLTRAMDHCEDTVMKHCDDKNSGAL